METYNIGQLISTLIQSLGIVQTIVSVLIFIFSVITINLASKLIEYFLVKRTKQIEKDKENKIQNIINQFFDNTDKYIEKVDESNQLNHLLLEKLQISASIEKFEILLDSFLGYNRDFSYSLYAKLIGYLNLNKFENFQHIRNEIKNLFIEKVINRINLFIIYDEKLTKRIKEECLYTIDEFLNNFIKETKEYNINEIKEFLKSDNGTIALIIELKEIIKNSYTNIIIKDETLKFLKG